MGQDKLQSPPPVTDIFYVAWYFTISREKIFANFADLSQFANIALILDPDPMPQLI